MNKAVNLTAVFLRRPRGWRLNHKDLLIKWGRGDNPQGNPSAAVLARANLCLSDKALISVDKPVCGSVHVGFFSCQDCEAEICQWDVCISPYFPLIQLQGGQSCWSGDFDCSWTYGWLDWSGGSKQTTLFPAWTRTWVLINPTATAAELRGSLFSQRSPAYGPTHLADRCKCLTHKLRLTFDPVYPPPLHRGDKTGWRCVRARAAVSLTHLRVMLHYCAAQKAKGGGLWFLELNASQTSRWEDGRPFKTDMDFKDLNFWFRVDEPVGCSHNNLQAT